MNNDRFKDKMKKLEQERDAILQKLTPEGQKEYQQKIKAYQQQHARLNKESGPDNHPEE